MKATIFHSIFFVKSLTFVLFCSVAMHYLHFVISYRDKWNFSVNCCTVSPLGDIGKYFAIVKQKVIAKYHRYLIIGIGNPSPAWCYLSIGKVSCGIKMVIIGIKLGLMTWLMIDWLMIDQHTLYQFHSGTWSWTYPGVKDIKPFPLCHLSRSK